MAPVRPVDLRGRSGPVLPVRLVGRSGQRGQRGPVHPAALALLGRPWGPGCLPWYSGHRRTHRQMPLWRRCIRPVRRRSGWDPHKRALRQTIGGITLVHGGNGIIYLLNEERISPGLPWDPGCLAGLAGRHYRQDPVVLVAPLAPWLPVLPGYLAGLPVPVHRARPVVLWNQLGQQAQQVLPRPARLECPAVRQVRSLQGRPGLPSRPCRPSGMPKLKVTLVLEPLFSTVASLPAGSVSTVALMFGTTTEPPPEPGPPPTTIAPTIPSLIDN